MGLCCQARCRHSIQQPVGHPICLVAATRRLSASMISYIRKRLGSYYVCTGDESKRQHLYAYTSKCRRGHRK